MADPVAPKPTLTDDQQQGYHELLLAADRPEWLGEMRRLGWVCDRGTWLRLARGEAIGEAVPGIWTSQRRASPLPGRFSDPLTAARALDLPLDIACDAQCAALVAGTGIVTEAIMDAVVAEMNRVAEGRTLCFWLGEVADHV